MRQASQTLDRLLHSFPEERENLRPYVDRAKAYSNECGCTMGGAFSVAALALVIVHFLLNGLFKGSVLSEIVWGTTFVFGASIVGKTLGITIARIRLALLYRQLQTLYQVERA